MEHTEESSSGSHWSVISLIVLGTFQQILGLTCVFLPQVRRFSEAFFCTEHQKPTVLTFQEGL